MDKLSEIASKAIADYGFRQIAMWSPQEVVRRWELSEAETALLEGPLREALEGLPIPVEPTDIPAEERRLERLIQESL